MAPSAGPPNDLSTDSDASGSVSVLDPLDIFGDEDLGECDPKSGVPKVLKAYAIHTDPKILLVPGFVGEAEIQHLLELAEVGWVPSEVGSGVYRNSDETKDLLNNVCQTRTSFSCQLESFQTQTVTDIEHRLALLAGIHVDYLEPLNMVRYAPGQFFKKHHDGRFRPKTIFIYLNDLPDQDGGETEFIELGIKVVPRRGCALVWSNVLGPQQDDKRLVHQGLPPKTAMKYGVNCFFNDKLMRVYESEGNAQKTDMAVSTPRPPLALSDVGLERWHTLDAAELVCPSPEGHIRRLRVHESPAIMVLPQLLSPAEANAMVALADAGMRLERLEDEELLFRVQTLTSSAVGLGTEYLDRVDVSKLKEQSGASLEHQLDEANYTTKFGHATALIFLNDVAGGGGELQFPHTGVQVRPRQGCAVVWSTIREAGSLFDARAMHRARPPTLGTRYAIICTFRHDGNVA